MSFLCCCLSEDNEEDEIDDSNETPKHDSHANSLMSQIPQSPVVKNPLFSHNSLENLASRGYEGKCLAAVSALSGQIFCVAVAMNGDIFSSGTDKSIKHWRINQDIPHPNCLKSYEGHFGYVRSICTSEIDKLISASDDKTIKVFDTKKGICLKTVLIHSNCVLCVLPWSDGSAISGGADKTLRHWSIADGHQLGAVRGAEGRIHCLARVRDDVVAAGEVESFKIRLYCVSSKTVLHVLTGHSGYVYGLSLGLEGELVSVSDDATIRAWSVSEEAVMEVRVIPNTTSLQCVAGLPDGSYISGGEDGVLRIWNASNGYSSPVMELAGHTAAVLCLSLSPVGDVVSASADGTFRVWT